MQISIKQLEIFLSKCTSENPYVYVETGRYKPYSASTVAAAKRRGYKVEKKCEGVFYIYPKVNP